MDRTFLRSESSTSKRFVAALGPPPAPLPSLCSYTAHCEPIVSPT